MNYQQALAYLEELNVFGMNFGLERIKTLLDLMGNPQNAYKTIHITGTNGKGSTAAMTASVLATAGFTTALYISPHLEDYTERMQINGENCSHKDFAMALTVVRDMCNFMASGGQEHPTQFEVLTAAAFWLFKEKKVDYAVIEVGLGGLLDSTNVLLPEVTVITNVTLEHADKCGGSLEGIAEHKAGIIKEGVPVVTGAQGVALEIIRKVAQDKKAPLYVLEEDFSADRLEPLGQLSIPPNLGMTGRLADKSVVNMQIEALSLLDTEKWHRDKKGEQLVAFKGLAEPMGNIEYPLALLGLHQVRNSSLAIAVLMLLAREELEINPKAIKNGMAKAKWPGRFELFERPEGAILLDGAHNPDGVAVLRESLDTYYPDKRRIFVLGMLADKAYEGMLRVLLRKEDRVILTTPLSDRAKKPQELLEYALVEEKYAIEDPQEALKRGRELLQDSGEDTLLICAGSLYLIGTLRGLLKK